MHATHDFWVKFNALAAIGIGLLYLATSILVFWMSNKQSLTLLLLIVFAAGTFGLHCRYSLGALTRHTRQSMEWNMRSQFYPLIHLFCYASICCINFIKVLATKYSIDIWSEVLDNLYDPQNFLLLILVGALLALTIITAISTNAHYRSSYGYEKFVRDRAEFQKMHENFSRDNCYMPPGETGPTQTLPLLMSSSPPPPPPPLSLLPPPFVPSAPASDNVSDNEEDEFYGNASRRYAEPVLLSAPRRIRKRD